MLDLTKIKFVPSSNYGNRGGNKPQIIVLHCPVGTMTGCIATFQNPNSKVSAHYVIGRDGSIVQMVALENVAWHAMHYPNMIGIGIEHEDRYFVGGQLTRGCMGDPTWFTSPELETSAELVANLMIKFGIPLAKVMGHNDPWLKQFGNNHTDPGVYFPWLQYRTLISNNLKVLQEQQTATELTQDRQAVLQEQDEGLRPADDVSTTIQTIQTVLPSNQKKPRYKGGRRLIKRPKKK